ncbi:N-acetyltransferase [Clostridium chromiireducens]|uniref:N-acetyltransferase n=2 Tax=Clostridium chromiireducens TaxID=225345 RepID=A0A399IP35_9CLOT|nr:GNAT family N-acetyltransferase [Clostridium chromiireducens]RII33202.1 N-acetyltransferase [Clostridium chromiireducens]
MIKIIKKGRFIMEIKKGVNKFYIGDTEENPFALVILSDIEQDVIKIEHTYVYEQLKGQGAGKELIKTVVDFAVEKNKKLIPVCSFAQKEFDKNKEYERVLYRGI